MTNGLQATRSIKRSTNDYARKEPFQRTRYNTTLGHGVTCYLRNNYLPCASELANLKVPSSS